MIICRSWKCLSFLQARRDKNTKLDGISYDESDELMDTPKEWDQLSDWSDEECNRPISTRSQPRMSSNTIGSQSLAKATRRETTNPDPRGSQKPEIRPLSEIRQQEQEKKKNFFTDLGLEPVYRPPTILSKADAQAKISRSDEKPDIPPPVASVKPVPYRASASASVKRVGLRESRTISNLLEDDLAPEATDAKWGEDLDLDIDLTQI